ncbi:ATP/maltotriose-dependent transcriptional regulator MalT [Nonomuraea thailandensis]|uniref:ATP/maltotriose-dependent transcriptional regulator MalT n=1 Tax=Nonomuraea thailandensis TaxID=1188745 RepID=A0A9X2GBZ1_9ACTN|nr:AAA family ATPase [Nonomuraea thailandensis]MCP2354559.1 ATP/maltotriose-dependent transcriptional regulator MalT [Nonomuraea thailandensis]
MSIHAVSPLFVGRARELAALGDALARSRAGASSTVLVGGEAGVGKTRLVKEFVDHRAGDALVLVGGCLELGTEGLPFAPFTAVLRGLVRELGRDAVAALVPGGNARALARLLPEFGEPGKDGPEARARLFEQVLGLLERLAEERPVVLIVEDAHWADRSTRDLLTFLVRYQRTAARLLVVVTYRTDELHRNHPLRPLLAELGRVEWVTRAELRRLTRREAVALAAGILEREPSPADMDLIYARSEGNPLFVEALLNECGGGEALPESLRDLLLASVERLPEETQELLRVASAGGQRIEHALLSAVAGLDENALSRALRPAVAGNVLVVDGEGYSFRHALIREALHDDLLPGEHVRLHTRYAEALERDLSILPAPRGAIELAHHWHSAHDSTWALTSAWHAAAAARKSTAYDEQLRMLSRVLELWDQVPDAIERIGADRIDVLRQTATVAHLSGEYERSIAMASAALDELDHCVDPIRAAMLLRQRGLTRYDLSRPGHLEDLRTAAALVPADQLKLRGQVLESLSRMLHRPEDRPERQATARHAMEIGHEVGDANVEAHAMISLTWGHSCYSDMDSQLAAFAEARRIASRDEAYNALMRCAISESDALEGCGMHERAAQVAREGVEEARQYGLARTSGTFLSINLAEPLVSLGRWDEALQVVEHALELAPPAPYRASLQGFATDIALARGQFDRAEKSLDASRSVLSRGSYRDQTTLPHLCREIRLLQARGQLDQAVETAARALEERDLVSNPRYAWPVLVAVAQLVWAAVPPLRLMGATAGPGTAEPSEAANLAHSAQSEGSARSVRSAESGGSMGSARSVGSAQFGGAGQFGQFAEPSELGAVARLALSLLPRLRALGGELLAEGDLQQAHRLTFGALTGPEAPLEHAAEAVAWRLKAWDLAVGAWEALREPYAEALCLLGAAQAALASGDRQGAAARITRSRDLARELGATPLLEQLDTFARRARIGGGSEEAAGGQPLGLTARELEVLREVTSGRSNREIAEELVISVKTVSVHVSNILAKLGVATRGEAAATAHRLRLFD